MTRRAAGQVLAAFGVCATLTVCTLYVTKSTAQRAEESQRRTESHASPIYGITIPAGYRDWRLISIARFFSPENTADIVGRSPPQIDAIGSVKY